MIVRRMTWLTPALLTENMVLTITLRSSASGAPAGGAELPPTRHPVVADKWGQD